MKTPVSKKCAACLESMDLSAFNKDGGTKDGYRARCRECDKYRRPFVLKRKTCKLCGTLIAARSQYCREHRAEVFGEQIRSAKNTFARNYNKTEFGLIVRTYRNMLSRVRGIQKHKAHLYLGKDILPKEQFYAWAQDDASYKELFSAWVASGYARTLTPSIDRIDSSGGYTIDNIRWITLSENSRLASCSRHSEVST